MESRIEEFQYDDAIVRKFLWATLTWGVVGMLVGLWVALQLAWHPANLGEWFTFGRLRPLHTNAIIFAFAGNGIFTGIYYSTQRLLKAPMYSRALSNIHFWGWQLIIVAAAITLPLGITQSKEYAELEWPIDIALTVIWVLFAINVFGTIAKRRERHLYVAIWFYIATILAIAILHIFNNLVIPATAFKSYSLYSGTQDAFMQWWYGHNAVAFFLTTPFLGLMYYFMPKAANRPVFSYKLSILHFWTIVFLYIWAGPHHLHYTALPAWAATLGMLFSLMLWMPSWGGMINGLLTLRGAWHKVAEDPILKFFVVAVTFYGMSTFEGPLLSIKSVNALSHYTDWTIAHVHAGGLGWVGFLLFGMIYWLAPRLFQVELFSKRMMELHFWIGTIGILFYIIPIYVAGITQGLMWFALDADGAIQYEFVETTARLNVFYWARVGGGLLYFSGTVMCVYNVLRTWAMRPKAYDVPVVRAAALSPDYVEPPRRKTSLEQSGGHVLPIAVKLEAWFQGDWHRRWEGRPLRFSVWVLIAVVAASAFEIVPTFLLKSNILQTAEDVEKEARIQPYTPLEVVGRDIYVANGCYNCHSQMVRPIYAETQRYGDYSKGIEFVYDRPFQWGSRRIGPDLHRVGGTRNHYWHFQHFRDPQQLVPDSIMPKYEWMLDAEIDFDVVQPSIDALVVLGTPYDSYLPRALTEAGTVAREQASRVARELAEQAKSNQPWTEDDFEAFVASYETKQIIALIAYLQRLGTDIYREPDQAKAEDDESNEPEDAPRTGSIDSEDSAEGRG